MAKSANDFNRIFPVNVNSVEGNKSKQGCRNKFGKLKLVLKQKQIMSFNIRFQLACPRYSGRPGHMSLNVKQRKDKWR